MTRSRGYNVACCAEDLASDEFGSILRNLAVRAPAAGREQGGAADRWTWADVTSIRTLQDHGTFRPEARVLVLGPATSPVVAYASRHVAEVVVVDPFLEAGERETHEALLMFLSPSSVSRMDLDPDRVTVRHADRRTLPFPPASFDGVVSTTRAGGAVRGDAAATAAYEIGRVLRPGGVAAIAVDFLVMGPREADAPAGARAFDESDIRRLLVEASGLEMLDDPDYAVSAATMEGARDVRAVLEDRSPDAGGDMPVLVAVERGQVVTAALVGLRKGRAWPASPNAWAAPTDALRTEVRIAAERLAGRLVAMTSSSGAVAAAPTNALAPSTQGPSASREALQKAFDAWDSARARTALTAPSWGPYPRRLAGFLSRTVGRIRDLGIVWDRERNVLRELIASQDDLERRIREIAERQGR